MKDQYENRTRFLLPRRTYFIVRLDQRCGHTYTSKLIKPFDGEYQYAMDQAAIALGAEIPGFRFAYGQSDEVSVLFSDFDKIESECWFDGNVQKLASVSASIFTAHFNYVRWGQGHSRKGLGYFDARVFTIPDRIEVMNYFRWRNEDCIRNSISSAALSVLSPKELHKQSSSDRLRLMEEKGKPWDGYCASYRYGRLITSNSVPAWNFKQDEILLKAIPIYP